MKDLSPGAADLFPPPSQAVDVSLVFSSPGLHDLLGSGRSAQVDVKPSDHLVSASFVFQQFLPSLSLFIFSSGISRMVC